MTITKSEALKLRSKYGLDKETNSSKGQGFLQETGQDIMQTGKNLLGTIKQTYSNIGAINTARQSGEQGMLRSFGQNVGAVAGGVSRGIGDLVIGGVKTVLPQSAETGVKQGIEKVVPIFAQIDQAVGSPVGTSISKYQSLDPKTKRDVDAVLGISSLALDVFGGGFGKKLTQEVGSKALTGGAELSSQVALRSSKLLKGGAESLYGVTITPQEATIRALVAYDKSQPSLFGRVKNFLTDNEVGVKPITEANTAARQGLVGTEYGLGVKASKIGDKLYTGIIKPKLQQVKNAVDMRQFILDVEKEVRKIPGLQERANLLNGLEKFKETYKNVGVIGGEKLQKYKEDWAKFLPDSVYKGKPIANALKSVNDIAAGKAREILYKIVGDDGKLAYLDYGNLKSIVESGVKSVKDPAKRSLSLGVWQTLMDKAITPVATISGQILYKTADGLEFIGKKGAKKVKDIIEPPIPLKK